MTPLSDVRSFVRDFQFKLDFRDKILFSSREKNRHTMLVLELSLQSIKKELRKITALDYSQGPLDDTIYGKSSLWVFVETIRGHEIHIKLRWGNSTAIHFASPFISLSTPCIFRIKNNMKGRRME